MTGYIYAIECAGRIKIGFSEDPERRFNKVASDAPFPCTLLAYWPGSRADELDAQNEFAETRVHGEWFAATESLLSFIAAFNEAKPSNRNRVELCDGIMLARGDKSRLAAHLGLSQPTLSRWKRVPAEHARRVSDFTGIPLADLRPDLFEGLEAAE